MLTTQDRIQNPTTEQLGTVLNDPFRLMTEIFNRPRWSAGWDQRAERFVPPFDVKERDDAFLLLADVPGMTEDDLEITMVGNRLTISGTRPWQKPGEKERFHSVERRYGAFQRSFTVPNGVAMDDIDANLENGVLSLAIPKAEETKPRKIVLKKRNPRTLS
ncbi:MAG: Hsp20/alpha crystallin family protein [Myxococcota bacterium]